jgi:hypothetical protein
MQARPLLPVLALVVGLGLVAGAPARAKTMYAVSLGDSLATGFELGANGTAVSSPLDYTQRVFARARTRFPGLKQRRFGCVGEDTTTFRFGSCAGARSEPQRLAQLKRAVMFLQSHRGRVAYVTLSLGAENFTPCITSAGMDAACVTDGQRRLTRDLPPIHRTLRRAAGPRTPIAQLLFYDPYVTFALDPGPDAHRRAAAASAVVRTLNLAIVDAGRAARLRYADGYTAFGAGDVTRACRLTQQCLPPPQANWHPTDAGYAALARAFIRTLGLSR